MLVNFGSLCLDLGLHVGMLSSAEVLGPRLGHFLLATSLPDHGLEDGDTLAHLGMELGLHGLNVELDVLPEGHKHVEGLGHVLLEMLFVHND